MTSPAPARASAPLSPLANFFIRNRSRDEVTIGLLTADQKRFGGAYKVVLPLSPGSPPIEAGQTLALRPGRIETERWSNGREAKVFVANGADVVPFVPRVSPKIAGIDSATCRNLADKLGANYAAKIAASPGALAAFRYSTAKREIIVAACKAEAKAGRKVKGDACAIVNMLRQCGVSARALGRSRRGRQQN